MGCDDQREMTPFQRQIYEAQKAHEAEEQRKQQEQARQGGGRGAAAGRTRNAAYNGGNQNTHSQQETVRYVSEDSETDANCSFVD